MLWLARAACWPCLNWLSCAGANPYMSYGLRLLTAARSRGSIGNAACVLSHTPDTGLRSARTAPVILRPYNKGTSFPKQNVTVRPGTGVARCATRTTPALHRVCTSRTTTRSSTSMSKAHWSEANLSLLVLHGLLMNLWTRNRTEHFYGLV
jgi:hypothetical protein